ncbi:HAD family hydrolase [Actinopolymorpha pittospori]|uniref:Cof subfamily protein (Haloacid dehalogenase superfamily) n=1 Tax=Actinopolymorpha pittospori TaxID=648752 RepID=A0A927RF32_9ACTN|nr:HAD family hydrolase [Actinopolymorpha pittospori]MBE1612889.1 Cof subfamily protein (haloacid dehalogenase superfamily) [Actinopolymorpha pittospori]
MTKTLYVTDLDGTLLTSAGTLSPFTAHTVNRLIEDQALPLTYATARSYSTAVRILAQCRFRLPVIVYNGAFTVEATTGKVIDSRYLEASTAEAVITHCRRLGLPPLVYHYEHEADHVCWVADQLSLGIRNYLRDRPGDPRLSPRTGWDELPTRNVFYISIIGAAEPIAELAAALPVEVTSACTANVQVDTYYPTDTWLEITPLGATKATAVQAVRESIGATRLVCFGDNHNDLPLFHIADESYAVRNASPAVTAAATGVIDSNDEDGVAHWLSQQHPA